MPLPRPPNRTGDVEVDLIALYYYMWDVASAFDNAAGSAIDPTLGQGGDGALTIVDAPSNITYTPGSSLSVDGTLFGEIEIAYTLPDRAIGVLIYYKETTDSVFKTSFSDTSPEKLINLKVGVEYDIQLAGEAANGSSGPVSSLVMLTIPTTPLDVTTPTDVQAVPTYQSIVLTWANSGQGVLLEYNIQVADDALFTVNVATYQVDTTYFIYDAGSIATTKYFRVQAVSTGGSISAYSAGVSATTLNVPDDSIVTVKILDANITTPKIADGNVTYAKVQDVSAASRVLGRGSSGSGDVQELSITAPLLLISGTDITSNPETGWSTTAFTPDKAFSGTTAALAETNNVLGTLLQTLIDKGVISA